MALPAAAAAAAGAAGAAAATAGAAAGGAAASTCRHCTLLGSVLPSPLLLLLPALPASPASEVVLRPNSSRWRASAPPALQGDHGPHRFGDRKRPGPLNQGVDARAETAARKNQHPHRTPFLQGVGYEGNGYANQANDIELVGNHGVVIRV